MKPLSRKKFREEVFKRDGQKCIFCDKPAEDAHHILERKLWPDGGYYLDNGASVCEEHHLKCESTEISVEEVREAAGIEKKILPPHLYQDQVYDKWGNIILPNGTRLKGEIFYDEGTQASLKRGGFIDCFIEYVKYPRTYHLPWSLGMHKDDRKMDSTNLFTGRQVVVTEKMDGENTSMYRDYIHARSVDSSNHISRDWVKNFWNKIRYEIPEGWRICGENLYAKHSISYEELPSYFMGFSIWNETNICLSWAETKEIFQLMEIQPVPVLYEGIYDERKIQSLWDDSKHSLSEGYVLRIADSFSYGDFQRCVGKFVRKDHVCSIQHWMHGQTNIEKNILKS